MSGRIVLMIVALVAAIGILTIAGSAEARGSHVEYVVPDDQAGISVDQKGNAGLVIVEVEECLVTGEEFAFTMLVSSERAGSSTLSMRKQGEPDVHRWFSLSQKTVDLPSDGTEVTVKIKPPVGAELDKKAVTRIQEVGDGPSPGGHHGVKVVIDCVEAPTPPEPPVTPSEEPEPAPPAEEPPEETEPGLTPTSTSTVTGPNPTPEPQMPTSFPDSGGPPPRGSSTSIALILAGAIAVVLPLLSFVGRRALLMR
jgi:hypothetical protein